MHVSCLSLHVLSTICILSIPAMSAMASETTPPQLHAAQGYTVEVVAESPLVAHPLMADFDEQGRLYVAATAGKNLQRAELEKQLPNFVQRLEDTDGDGKFDKATLFADNLTFPQGCLWMNGSLYVASSGALWKFTDTNDDGVADERVELVSGFGYTGNAADIHGPFAGPDHRIYWCDGRHGHEIKDDAGNLISRGKAARIFSCKPDGTDVQTYAMGGMDNPVEVTFLPQGEMLGTVNLMHGRPRGDTLVHWQYGGVYPQEYFVESLGGEFTRTGPLLPEVHNFGHVAVSGLCRIERADESPAVLVTQFNTNRVVKVELQPAGASFAVNSVQDFFVSSNTDSHPTDVLQDADGSYLVIDTGGWFRIGCPQSQVEKSHLHGAIYRLRKVDETPVADARGTQLDWTTVSDVELLGLLEDSRPAVRSRAVQTLAERFRKNWNETNVQALSKVVADKSPSVRRQWGQVLSLVDSAPATALLAMQVRDSDAGVRKSATRRLLYATPLQGAAADELFTALLHEVQNGDAAESANALATIGRHYAQRPGFASALLALPKMFPLDANWRHAFVYALIESKDRETIGTGRFHAEEAIQLASTDALNELRRIRPSMAEQTWLEIPAAGLGTPLTESDKARMQEIAALMANGNAENGLAVFKSEKTNCVKCHRIGNDGGQIGPDLTTIGKSRGGVDLLEAILYPSSSFARGFAPYLVATEDGRTFSGIVLGESNSHVRLGLNIEQSVSIPIPDIEEIRAADLSIMPSDVAKQLSPQEIVDLIAYLKTLK